MSDTNILSRQSSEDLLKIRTVSEVMQKVIYVFPTADLASIARIMTSENTDSVVIAQKRVAGAKREVFPLGIIVKRDIELIQALKQDLAKIQAETVMSRLSAVHPTDSLWNAYSQMQHSNLQQLVVVGDDEELLGIVTLTSCLPIIVSVKKTTTMLSIRR